MKIGRFHLLSGRGLRRELRAQAEEATYTEQRIQQAYRNAAQSVHPQALAAVEASIGTIARAFSMGRVNGLTGRFQADSDFLAIAARQIMATGEALFYLDGGRPVPATGEVQGRSLDPIKWRYRLDLASPDRQTTVSTSGASVLHFRYQPDPRRPWAGVSPLSRAAASAAVAAELEATVSRELKVPIKRLVSLPGATTEEASRRLMKDVR